MSSNMNSNYNQGLLGATTNNAASYNSLYDNLSTLYPTNYSPYNDEVVFLHSQGISLIREEMAGKDLNIEELNKLINSTSQEDFELALNSLEVCGCKYSVKILRALRNEHPFYNSVREILREKMNKNLLNITNKFI